MDLGPTLTQCDLILINYIGKDPNFQIWLHSELPGGHEFGVDTIIQCGNKQDRGNKQDGENWASTGFWGNWNGQRALLVAEMFAARGEGETPTGHAWEITDGS